MATATWIKSELEQQGIPYEERHHPEVFTSQAVAQCEHMSGHRVAKVVVAIADGRPIELILPASRQVNLERVREIVGAREVRLASEQELEKQFGECETGAIPALRHWRGVDVLMDSFMRVQGKILIQAGTHSDAVSVDFDDWFHLVQPWVASFSQRPDSTPRNTLWEYGEEP
jgi:Ala-tRNA(Pro) deacylase